MILLYTFLQIILLPLLFLPLAVIILLTPKYRMRSLHRLGFGLQTKKQTGQNKKRKTIWIHALSVGEVTSALPLVSGLRKEMPDVELVFSATSSAGAKVAEKLLHNKVDRFVAFPFDIFPVIKRFLRVIQPDLFILVETDFWPGLLSTLKAQGIPSLLVNGRISDKSIQSYRRFSFFFRPLFASFKTLSMQTENDKDKLISLDVDHRQIETLGNLKYDTALYSSSQRELPISFSLPGHSSLLVAGSTHAGEEQIILQAYKELKASFPQLYLVIAPRDINQGKEIQTLAADMQLQGNRRSQINAGGKDLFILDSIGELNGVYSYADIAFVGGSLVPKGGHNPIEPAIFSVPVLYGHHMNDFSEISDKLIQAGGAFMIHNQDEMSSTLRKLLDDPEFLQETGKAAQNCIRSQQGVIKRHLALIKEML